MPGIAPPELAYVDPMMYRNLLFVFMLALSLAWYWARGDRDRK